MIKAILAIDERGGVSKNGSMPWPRNAKDMSWFKSNTKDHIVIMGRNTWVDPNMRAPLPKRINVLATNKEPGKYKEADFCIKGDLIEAVKNFNIEYPNKIKWIIGGPKIVNQLFNLIEEFYITRIYGNFSCDTHLDINRIESEMKIIKNIKGDSTCHFEIWSK